LAAGLAALSITLLIGWGFILGLEYPGRLPRPVLITVKIVMVSVRSRQPPSRLLPAFPLPHLPVRPPQIVPPPMPEVTVAAPTSKFVPAPPAPKNEHVVPDRAKPEPPPAPPPADYLSLLLAHLNAYKHYPYGARLHHEQGTVRLEFTMDRAGNVLSYRVVGSSGYPDLDDEARAMILNAQPLPPVPTTYPGTTLDLVLPLVFSLD
jgi:periplasmic protein TonB